MIKSGRIRLGGDVCAHPMRMHSRMGVPDSTPEMSAISKTRRYVTFLSVIPVSASPDGCFLEI